MHTHIGIYIHTSCRHSLHDAEQSPEIVKHNTWQVKAQNMEGAEKMLQTMRDKGVKPNTTTYR